MRTPEQWMGRTLRSLSCQDVMNQRVYSFSGNFRICSLVIINVEPLVGATAFRSSRLHKMNEGIALCRGYIRVVTKIEFSIEKWMRVQSPRRAEQQVVR